MMEAIEKEKNQKVIAGLKKKKKKTQDKHLCGPEMQSTELGECCSLSGSEC